LGIKTEDKSSMGNKKAEIELEATPRPFKFTSDKEIKGHLILFDKEEEQENIRKTRREVDRSSVVRVRSLSIDAFSDYSDEE
jgi:hypothetical protein